MIIQLESATAENAEAAMRSLAAIARSWGHEITETPAGAATAAGIIHDDGKVIDPVSAAALVLSIPSAALAVLDLADRIRKRRRASELIDYAQQLAARQVTIWVMSRSRAVELRTLTPPISSSTCRLTKIRPADSQLADPTALPEARRQCRDSGLLPGRPRRWPRRDGGGRPDPLEQLRDMLLVGVDAEHQGANRSCRR